MSKLIKHFCLLIILAVSSLSAKANFAYTDNCVKAQQLIYRMRFDEAQSFIDKEKTSNPDNGIIHLLENYISFIKVFINEDKQQFEEFEKLKNDRISAIKKNDKSSPFYKFCIAEINFQWAIARLKFQEYMTAGLEFKDAYNLHYDNIEEHPDFLPSYKTFGLLKALIGTVPEKYQWVTNMLGFKGSIKEGMSKIQMVSTNTSDSAYLKLYKYEAGLIEAGMQLHLNKNEELAWANVSKITKDYQTNLMSNFFRANIAMRTGKNDIAIEVLSAKPITDGYFKFYYLDYMLGLAKLQRLDRDADIHFKVYTTFFKGRNYLKSAYQKIAWYNLINGSEPYYHRYMKMCAAFGHDDVEDDKQAYKEATSGVVPDRTLLSARLLFDAGYHNKAYDMLKNKSIVDFISDKDQVEFTYRKARIAHKLGNVNQAIELYKNTMILGKELPYYFAANSSLQLAMLYEELGMLDEAEYYYKNCKTFSKNKEYQDGIEQKAKAGLKRIEEKREEKEG